MTIFAAQTEFWLGLGLAAGALFAVAALVLLAVFFAVFDGDDDVSDVERFVAMTAEGRSLDAAGSFPLSTVRRRQPLPPRSRTSMGSRTRLATLPGRRRGSARSIR